MKVFANLILFCVIFSGTITAQKIKLIKTGVDNSFRGLSVVDDKVVWVSGNNGTVGRSYDGGKTFEFIKVKGFEKIDFRDIEAFDGAKAIIMGIASPGYVLKTIDGGQTWKVVYENKSAAVFMDAIFFWNYDSGIILGDPINGKTFMLRSFDNGDSWTKLSDSIVPTLKYGEAFFASSGTNICGLNHRSEACFVSGGMASNFYKRNKQVNLPLSQGRESAGANSIAVRKKKIIVVGGDFNNRDKTDSVACYSNNGGKTFKLAQKQPSGYRSCVIHVKKRTWLACGLNGVDISKDNGKTWTQISKDGFHTAHKAKLGKNIVLSGGNGKIGLFEY